MTEQSTKYVFRNSPPFHPWKAIRGEWIGRGFSQSEALMDLELRILAAEEREAS